MHNCRIRTNYTNENKYDVLMRLNNEECTDTLNVSLTR